MTLSHFPTLNSFSISLKSAVEIYVKNGCNSILASICAKKFQLLRTCHESAVSKQWRGFQSAQAVFYNITRLERQLKPSRANIHMACSQFEWLQLRFIGSGLGCFPFSSIFSFHTRCWSHVSRDFVGGAELYRAERDFCDSRCWRRCKSA